MADLKAGAVWSWRGQFQVVADEDVRRCSGGSAGSLHATLADFGVVEGATGVIVLTNGAQRFMAFLYKIEGAEGPMLVFEGGWPERQQEFWIDDVVQVKQAGGEVNQSGASVIALPSRPSMERDIHAVPRLPAATASPVVD